jgi:hypothetical protein
MLSAPRVAQLHLVFFPKLLVEMPHIHVVVDLQVESQHRFTGRQGYSFGLAIPLRRLASPS